MVTFCLEEEQVCRARDCLLRDSSLGVHVVEKRRLLAVAVGQILSHLPKRATYSVYLSTNCAPLLLSIKTNSLVTCHMTLVIYPCDSL